jgi:hypothetical protein
VSPASCTLRRTGGLPMPRTALLPPSRPWASCIRAPTAPSIRASPEGARHAGIEVPINGDFPFTHGKVPFRMEISHSHMERSHSEWRFPIHAWTISILNGDLPFMPGDFMSILKGHEWTFEWDYPVSQWEKMAHRPFTYFSYQLNGDKGN